MSLCVHMCVCVHVHAHAFVSAQHPQWTWQIEEEEVCLRVRVSCVGVFDWSVCFSVSHTLMHVYACLPACVCVCVCVCVWVGGYRYIHNYIHHNHPSVLITIVHIFSYGCITKYVSCYMKDTTRASYGRLVQHQRKLEWDEAAKASHSVSIHGYVSTSSGILNCIVSSLQLPQAH